MRTVRSGTASWTPGWAVAFAGLMGLLLPVTAFASELDLKLPTLDPGQRQLLQDRRPSRLPAGPRTAAASTA